MRVETDQGIKLHGIYKGVVLKHLNNGKLKVWFPGIYPNEWNDFAKADLLPDCIIAPPLFGGNNKGNGVFSYPNNGAILLCFFDNGDQNFPIAFASLQGGELAQEQFKEAKIVNSSSVEEEGDDARVHKIITDKAFIKMWESGKIQIRVYQDRKFNQKDEIPTDGCQIDISEAGTINIKSSSQIHLESPEIKMDCSAYELHAGTIKVQASNAIQVDTQTLLVNADSRLSVCTPNEIHENSSSYYLDSPNINIDGRKGHVSVKGAPNHAPIFM